MHSHPPIPYAAIRHHGVVGDRRTAALVSADGTIDWLALPDYDGNILFGRFWTPRRAATGTSDPAFAGWARRTTSKTPRRW